MMNKRIRELAGQTWDYVDSQNPYASDEHEMFQEKFAELIVQECIEVLNKRFMGDLNREDQEVRRCIKDLKKHFGAES